MSASHGQTPAAWTGVALAGIGFTVGSIGFMMGPAWWVIGIGAAFIVAGLVAAWAMSLAGLGEGPRRLQ